MLGDMIHLKKVKRYGADTGVFWVNYVNIVSADGMGPLLLTWFNFNPSMDK